MKRLYVRVHNILNYMNYMNWVYVMTRQFT